MDQQVLEYKQLESTFVAQGAGEKTAITLVHDSINTLTANALSVKIEIARLAEVDSVVTRINRLIIELDTAKADRKAALKQELSILDQKLYDLSVPPISNMSDVMKFIKYRRKYIKDVLSQPEK
jgi:hypothetical protein